MNNFWITKTHDEHILEKGILFSENSLKKYQGNGSMVNDYYFKIGCP
jgi:hypothetical protein